MPTRYDALYLAASPLLVPYLGWRWAKRGKYRKSGRGMLGADLPLPEEAARFAGGSVWIHAVSVGETAAARALEPGLRKLFPDLSFVVSTVTETGQEAARKSIPGAEAHTFFPVDLSWNVEKFLDRFRPKHIVLLEAEIWPNFLTLARRRGASIFLLNARMSDRSFPRYRRAGKLAAPIFNSFAGFCAQTELDAERLGALGVEPARIRVTGNCKFDLTIPGWAPEERRAERARLGIADDQPVIVAGSTHPGEEELILRALADVRGAHPRAALILAPRHPERFGAAAEIARAAGYKVSRASAAGDSNANIGPAEVVILDQMGVLARAYGLGDVAIVAGSFCDIGGHNLLEAAAHEMPVIYGPRMHSQREIARLFAQAGAGTQVEPGALGPALVRLLADAELRKREGAKTLRVLLANQGSAERSIAAIRGWLGRPN